MFGSTTVTMLAWPAVAALLLTPPTSAPVLSCSVVPDWQQQGERRSFEPDNLFDYMDGNAEGYLVYGFTHMEGITCAQQDQRLVIDVSDMGDAEHAYGMLSANRDPRVPLERIGMGAQITPSRATLAKGRFYLEVAAQGEGDHSALLRTFATRIAATFEGRETLPDALAWFPQQGRTGSEPRLVPESVLGIRLLESGYTAAYDVGEAFIVPLSSPEKASAVMTKLRERFGETSPLALADEAFTSSDRYLGDLLVCRKGAFLVGVARIPPTADARPLTETLVKGLP